MKRHSKKRYPNGLFRGTAAGVWVNKKSEATNLKGQILGGLFDFEMASLGGIGMTYFLSKTGRDQLVTKGLLFGLTMGSVITAFDTKPLNNYLEPTIHTTEQAKNNS